MYVGLDTKIRAGTGALALTLLLAGCATGPPMCGRASMCPERSRSGPPVPRHPRTAGWKPLPPRTLRIAAPGGNLP